MPNDCMMMIYKFIKYFIDLYIYRISAFIATYENERIYQVMPVRYRSNFEGNGYKMRRTASTGG